MSESLPLGVTSHSRSRKQTNPIGAIFRNPGTRTHIGRQSRRRIPHKYGLAGNIFFFELLYIFSSQTSKYGFQKHIDMLHFSW